MLLVLSLLMHLEVFLVDEEFAAEWALNSRLRGITLTHPLVKLHLPGFKLHHAMSTHDGLQRGLTTKLDLKLTYIVSYIHVQCQKHT